MPHETKQLTEAQATLIIQDILDGKGAKINYSVPPRGADGVTIHEVVPEKKRRGRPPGSRNKLKVR